MIPSLRHFVKFGMKKFGMKKPSLVPGWAFLATFGMPHFMTFGISITMPGNTVNNTTSNSMA